MGLFKTDVNVQPGEQTIHIELKTTPDPIWFKRNRDSACCDLRMLTHFWKQQETTTSGKYQIELKFNNGNSFTWYFAKEEDRDLEFERLFLACKKIG